ncbi:hypothetical protein [Bradyrhizobium sp.]|uniref:YncE family protein n=1 Tax=Bradyrhizobium sp. TaxID=376 RepID=UPI001EC74A46|nr:hypothetical protein [Bradyrhizobium sp.]MBV9981725.1 hypothetical protein [Bradyrhizobium sp.]
MRPIIRVAAIAAGLVAALIRTSPAAAELHSREQQIDMPGSPFAVVTTPDGTWVFVSVRQSGNGNTASGTSGIAVLERTGRSYRIVRFVAMEHQPAGLAMSRNGALLFAAASSGVAVFDVQRAIAGAPGTLIGFQELGLGFETIEVVLSADQRFVFAANELAGTVSVIDLADALRSKFAATAIVGQIPADFHPVGLAVSSDGAHLYITNERAKPGTPGLNPSACRVPTGTGSTELAPEGTILVVDIALALVAPSSSVVRRVVAGCSPVRIRLADWPDQSFPERRQRQRDTIAWVSLRGEDRLNGFSTERLMSAPGSALLASALVGPAPVGVQPFADGRLIAVANSNRFGGSAPGSVSVVSASEALRHAPATLTTFPVGVFPREWAISPDGGRLFLTEFGSSMLDIFDIEDLLPQRVRARDPE